ncbi:MAG TPA: hypothetical protein PKD53_04710 [Chloroflexaceae bacterium]|nr:hypothetical protein [Chloroflexaceae bacterium]
MTIRRWYLCPVDLVQDVDPETGQAGEPYRIPRPGRLINPATGRGYAFSAAVHEAAWAVCQVAVEAPGDLVAIAADGACLDLLEGADGAELDRTPAALGWPAARTNRLRGRLTARGISTAGLTNQTPLGEWLDRLMAAVHPSFRARSVRAHAGAALREAIQRGRAS